MGEEKVASRNVGIVFIVLIVLVWVIYYFVGSPSFKKDNAISIYGMIIQGMSALLSVALAVVIFRIQSLENRNQSLEQLTLSYIHQVVGWSYPAWTSAVEDEIKNKSIRNRYYESITSASEEFRKEERDRQQRRLEETVNLRTETNQRIERTKNRIIFTLAFLIAPILISLFYLMASDAFASWVTFYSVSSVILLSAFGVVLLILTVVDSLP